jgi:hypothetical protein
MHIRTRTGSGEVNAVCDKCGQFGPTAIKGEEAVSAAIRNGFVCLSNPAPMKKGERGRILTLCPKCKSEYPGWTVREGTL